MRELYPTSSHPSYRTGTGLGEGVRPLAPEPTAAVPGSAERIAVLAQRAKDNLSLWHPDDAALVREPERVPWTVPECRVVRD